MIQDLLANLISIVGIKTILVSTFILYILNDQRKKHFDKSLPPLAPGYVPILGHFASVLKKEPLHEMLTNWRKQVGPIYTCYFGSQKWVVLNDLDVVRDLIVKRGDIYSSRNMSATKLEYIFQGERSGAFAFYKYGPAWRKLRRIAHTGMAQNKISDYQPIFKERREAFLSLLYDISQSETNINEGSSLNSVLEHYTMTVVLSIAFGNMYSFEVGDPNVHEVFTNTKTMIKVLGPVNQMHEFFPILNTIWPINHHKYLKLRHSIHNFFEKLLNEFKSKYEKDPDSIGDCFIKEILKNGELNDQEIAGFIAIFVGAGSATTEATLQWVISLLANHPDVQEKAFKEIEQVIGLDRLPIIDDEPNLPYIQSIILETLRLRSPVPITIPRSNMADDVYKNWVIPKDTIIIINPFSINMDEERFPNPQSFNPDRYMDYIKQKKKIPQSLEDLPYLSFSAGRRACVGMHLAHYNLFMAVSMLLATFKFERISDELIDTRTKKDLYNSIYAPNDYKVRLVPRHKHIPNLL